MAKHILKINHWDFILNIADDYLTFLRNLVPITLFMSLSFLMFTEIRFSENLLKSTGLFLFAIFTLIIATNAMIINLATFSRKVLIVLYSFQGRSLTTSLSLYGMLKAIWQTSHFKQLLFLICATTMAMIIVIIYGIRYAFDFYRLISNIG